MVLILKMNVDIIAGVLLPTFAHLHSPLSLPSLVLTNGCPCPWGMHIYSLAVSFTFLI